MIGNDTVHKTPSSEDISVEQITPELAETYMGKNTHNRNLRSRTVAAYAADMEAGNWDWNGESIKFAADGTLLDGQHRLAAIIACGKPTHMLVIRGLPNSCQDNIDGGIKRTFADVLKLHGEPNYTTLAAICRGVYQWDSGIRKFGGAGTKAVTHTQLLATLEKYPELRDSIAIVESARSGAMLPSTVGGPLWWRFSQIDPTDADNFFQQLASGADLPSGSPVLVLRRILFANRENKNAKGTTRGNTVLAAIVCKAWNKYRQGESVQSLSWRPGGANPEKFPEPE